MDSGQCGIFDFDYFINTREECDEDWYLNNIVGDKDFKITDNDGVIVDSVRRSDIEKNVRLVASGAKYRLPPRQEKLSPKEDLKIQTYLNQYLKKF